MQAKERYCLNWEEAYPAGCDLVGGKGLSIARLDRFGFKVPPGVILTTSAYADFIEYNQLGEMISSVSAQVCESDQVEFAFQLEELRARFCSGSIPLYILEEIKTNLTQLGIHNKALAIRSSASLEDSQSASFAGIHESFLNVVGWEAVQLAIKECYASLWTPRAIAYRRKLKINHQGVVPAVVMMEMFNAACAGVALSCDPQSGRRSLLTINANFGLGESIVSGLVEPDSYCLETGAYEAALHIVSKHIGRKEGLTRLREGGGTELFFCHDNKPRQVLSDQEIERLGSLVVRVSNALGNGEQEQDIEWAFDGKDFALLQVRPVTALPEYTLPALRNKTTVWSNGNYREAVPMVLSPLHRHLMKSIIDTIQFSGFSFNEYPMPEGFQFSRLFNGRLYCNISALQWAYYDCSGMLPGSFNPFWGGHQPVLEIEDPDPYRGEIGMQRQRRAMLGQKLVIETAEKAGAIFAGVRDEVQSLSRLAFKDLPDNDFKKIYDSLGRVIEAYCQKFTFLTGVGSMPLMMVIQILAPYLGPRTMSVVNALLVGGDAAITSAEHGYRLMELAQTARLDSAAAGYLQSGNYDPLLWAEQIPENSVFKQAFRDFIQEYGHRAVYEMDIINPRWEEDPTYLLDIIKGTMDTADPSSWRKQQKEKFEHAWQEAAELIPADQFEALRKGIDDAQAGAGVREMTKSVLVQALRPYRLIALELGRRFYDRGLIDKAADIFFCTWPEIFAVLGGEWDAKGWQAIITERIHYHQAMEKIDPPDVIIGETQVFSEPVITRDGDYMQGVGAASGRASGIARIISHPDQGRRLQPGEVLVAPSTDPSWTPLFLNACAVVMETGGFLSHGSIVAREYGVPAVVNVPGAMKAIKDGCSIVVDGDEGRVYFK